MMAILGTFSCEVFVDIFVLFSTGPPAFPTPTANDL